MKARIPITSHPPDLKKPHNHVHYMIIKNYSNKHPSPCTLRGYSNNRFLE